jgi:hypothetical protein
MKIITQTKQTLFMAAVLSAGSCAGLKAQSETAVIQPVTSVKRLSQGWSKSTSDWFHSTSQGSHFMPYAFYIALEQADSTEMLNSAANLEKLRCIPRPVTAANKDGLPIGFVADEGSTLPKGLIDDNRSMGFTCAACHTSQIHYQGQGLLIDGGPTLADIDGLIKAVKNSLKETLNDSEKFNRFSQKVLKDQAGNAQKKELLRKTLRETTAARIGYDEMNYSSVPYGFARLDAFGRIFNNSLVLVKSKDHVSPNAPVSYPFLWDTVKANSVQWTGNAANGALGSLGRNVGEVVGVFGAIDSGGKGLPHGYASSVHFENLKKLEKALHGLKAPAWPTDVLPKIDQTKAAAGEKLFKQKCASCHKKINPLSNWPILNYFVDSFKSQKTPLEDTQTRKGPREGVHTDATAAALIRDSRADSGKLSGQRRLLTLNDKYAKVEPVTTMVTDAVARVLIGMAEGKRGQSSTINKELIEGEGLKKYGNTDELAPLPVEEEEGVEVDAGAKAAATKGGKAEMLVYRARPLDGIWATGPFLHNGSVPTLFDLMLPEARRPKNFAVGHREFDPVKVGPVTTPASDTFDFNTRLKGNSNRGHDYGTSRMTDEQRWQLVEYMKTL